MWRGHEEALALYGMDICVEWVSRGFNDTCYSKIMNVITLLGSGKISVNHGLRSFAAMPAWLGDQDFHLAHRSNLIRKDPAFYGRLWPATPDNLPYVWPV